MLKNKLDELGESREAKGRPSEAFRSLLGHF